MPPMRACSLLLISSISLGTPAVADTRYELKGNELVVPHPIAFETAKDTVKPESDDAIAYVKGYLDAKSYISTLRIEVHSDNMGAEGGNQTLTEKRALAVAKTLVAKGVDCKRLIPVGFGSSKPVADNKTADGKAKNRRTQFFNAALRDKPIGGAPLDGGGKVAGDPCK